MSESENVHIVLLIISERSNVKKNNAPTLYIHDHYIMGTYIIYNMMQCYKECMHGSAHSSKLGVLYMVGWIYKGTFLI